MIETETEIFTDPLILTKYFAADEVNFTPGERSFVAWVSTEMVDREGDLVVASGVDYKSQYLGDEGRPGNPLVVAIHDYGKWPIGQCEWLKVKQGPNWRGLYAKATIDDTPDTAVVWAKMQRRTVRGVSIGFLPPQDLDKKEWGPPTADELKRFPHWKGARRVIRRCVMVEFSICPIGMNPSALIEAVAKGMHKPQFKEPTVDEPSKTEPDADLIAKAAEAAAREAEDETDEAPEEEGPIRKGACVKCVKGMHKGMVGRVKSVHRAGMVPDVDDDVHATKGEPAVRVQCYKAMGDGHRETEVHVGCKMTHLEKTDEFKAPKKKKGVDLATLPALTGRTDDQVAALQLKTVAGQVREALQQKQDRMLGAV